MDSPDDMPPKSPNAVDVVSSDDTHYFDAMSSSASRDDRRATVKSDAETLHDMQAVIRSLDSNRLVDRLRSPQVDVSFRELTYRVRQSTCFRRSDPIELLHSLSGEFRSGQLTAVMGPSGSGKTTLLNILAGFVTQGVSGSILVNGRSRSLRRFRKIACYIMQQDRLLELLTVDETLMVAARLKLPSTLSASERRTIVDEILRALCLQECASTRTGSLSSGQRKRLVIAQELVNQPPVMMLDEPTSGLDSSASFQCVALLRALSERRSIVCSIHQPSARLLEQFDRLYMLSEGVCIYRGRVAALLPYLASRGLVCPQYHNPADYLTELASGAYGPEAILQLGRAAAAGECERFDVIANTIPNNTIDKSAEATTSEALPLLLDSVALKRCESASIDNDRQQSSTADNFSASASVQFRVLLARTLRCIWRDSNLTHLRIGSHIANGLLIGALYAGFGNESSLIHNNAASLFITVMFVMFTALMPTTLTFPLEKDTLAREHLNYWYSLKTYYLAKTLADVPFQIFLPLSYSSIVYWLTDQPAEWERFAKFQLIIVLISLVSQSLGLLIGAASSLSISVFLAPVLNIPLLLFSGFFINLGSIPRYFYWLTLLSPVRYAFEAILLAVYGDERAALECEREDHARLQYCYFDEPIDFLAYMNASDASYWVDVAILLLFFVVLRVSAYVALKIRVKWARLVYN